MGAFLSFGGGVSIDNLEYDPVLIGFGSDGFGTQIPGNAAAFVKGATTQLAASVSADLAGIILVFLNASASNGRYNVDISLDGGSTWFMENIYVAPNNNAGGVTYYPLPINIPQGSDFRMRCSGEASNRTVNVAVIGVPRSAQSRPLYNNAERLFAADTAANYATTSAFGVALASSTVWTELVASTSREYKALLPIIGESGAATTIQPISVRIATGAAGSETEIARFPLSIGTSSPRLPRGICPLISKVIPVGTRVSMHVYAATPGSDTIRPQIWGFY